MIPYSECWWKRLRLLEAIKKNGDSLPISVVCKSIFCTGKSFNLVTNEMQEMGFIIKSKQTNNTVKTYITPKGERLIVLLRELKEMCGSGRVI